MTNVYVSSVAYAAETAWSAGLVVAAGGIVRQTAGVAVGSERCFRTALGGTTGGSQPTWDLSKDATQPTDGTITDWVEVTGSESLQAAGAWRATYARIGSAHAIYVDTVAVGAGGTGYTLNDILTLTTGTTYGSACTVKATGVSGGVVTAVTKVSGGSYRAAAGPNATGATSGGSGSGCTITVTTAGNLANGDTAFVASNHSATQSTTLRIDLRGTALLPTYTVAVDETASGHVPPLDADVKTTPTAVEATTGTVAITLEGATNSGVRYVSGVKFTAGSSGNVNVNIASAAATNGLLKFKNCYLKNSGTGTIAIGVSTNSNPMRVVFDGTQVEFGSATAVMGLFLVLFEWLNTTSAIQGTAPTTLFSSIVQCVAKISDVDLSAIGSGKSLVNNVAATQFYQFAGCKLNSAVAIAVAQTTPGRASIDVIACDSGNANGTMRHERYTPEGSQVIETTIIPTLAANQAGDGVTEVSWKVVSSTLATFINPFECMKIPFLVETTGSQLTAKIYIVNDGVTLNNDEAWVEVEYPGEAATPLMSVATSGKLNVLSTAAANALSTFSWVTTGLSSPIRQELYATFTPAQVGICYLTIKVGRASTTLYASPLVEVV